MHQAVSGTGNCWLLLVKRWLHPEWEGTVQQWYNWLDEKKKDEGNRRAEERQKLVSRMISIAEGRAGFLHRIKKPAAPTGGLEVLEELEEDV